uniref:Cytochrome P450 n=1 Tax=Oryza barthii TaxID=65489 RepID=A0A0D3G7U7_9ORYZ
MEIELSTVLLLPFLLLGFLYLTGGVLRSGGNARRRLAPAPRGLPVIGNLHQVGALPHRALRALAAATGAPHLLRLRLGHVTALVASSPAAAAAVMREHDHVEEDFVDVLLALQEESQRHDGSFKLTRDIIKSLLQDMFAAGTDTSFITLEWAMSELVKNPAAMRKLQDEVRRGGGATTAATPYLKAVVKETLRLHPPVPLLVPRECARDTDDDATVLGYHVAGGTRVFVNAWAIHRDAGAWSSPEEFRPERFLPGGGEAEAVDLRGGHFQLVPFGAGRRVCPGMQFALATVELALASLVRLFDWEIPPPGELDMSDDPGFTVRRRIPLRLVAKPVGSEDDKK